MTKYLRCPLRKNQAQISIEVCHKQKCIWLVSENERFRCGYEHPSAGIGRRPRVRKISREGITS
jgi:hypothetical protein